MSVEQFLITFGYLGPFGTVFAESGILVRFFLPGDSLLFAAGLLAFKGFFNLPSTILYVFVAAVLGDFFGQRAGRKIFQKEDSWFFHKKNLDRAEVFYEKHGPNTIILARFTPIVPTFAPILAGVARMNYQTFLIYNLVGGALWSVTLTLAGYFLGNLIPDVDKYLLPFVFVIVVLSFIPAIYHLYIDNRHGANSK